MNLTLFRQLYESTFKAEPLLAGFWSVAMYDLEEESFSSWATMREKLEENARNQRKMLKTLFDGSSGPSADRLSRAADGKRRKAARSACGTARRRSDAPFGVNHGIKTYS